MLNTLCVKTTLNGVYTLGHASEEGPGMPILSTCCSTIVDGCGSSVYVNVFTTPPFRVAQFTPLQDTI